MTTSDNLDQTICDNKKARSKKKIVSVCHWQRLLLNSKSCAVSSDVIQKPFKKAIFIFFFFFCFWRDYFAERDGKRRKRKFRRELNDLRPSSRSRAGELFVWSNVAGMTFQVEWPNCRRCCWNTGDHHRLWWWSNNSSLVIRRWFPANDMASVMCNRLGWMWVAPHHHHQRREVDFNTQHDNSVVYVRKPLEITVRIYSPVSLSCNCGPFYKNRNENQNGLLGGVWCRSISFVGYYFRLEIFLRPANVKKNSFNDKWREGRRMSFDAERRWQKQQRHEEKGEVPNWAELRELSNQNKPLEPTVTKRAQNRESFFFLPSKRNE